MAKTNRAKFLNFTDLEEKEAKELYGRIESIIMNGERNTEDDRVRANDAISIWKNEFWDEEDKKFFEDKFNITPYQVNPTRPLISKLVNQQRATRYDFYVKPEDEHSFERQRKGRDQFVNEYYQDFDTVEQAKDYYDRYYDDEYARAISIHYNKIRNRTLTKHVESDCFENMIITGVDFLKTTFTRQYNPDGEILTERRSVRQMIWDRTSVDPFLKDIEYIGEIHRLYMNDLVEMFPDKTEEIETHYESYTNLKGSTEANNLNTSWIDFYEYENHGIGVRTKVAEIWFKQAEPRFQIVEKKTGIPRLVRYGMQEDEIMETLKEIELDDVTDMAIKGEVDAAFFQRPKEEVEDDIAALVEEKYELRQTQVSTWYKALVTHQGILELKRNPLPTETHPYTPVFAQFTEGWFTGIIDDVRDLLLAYNKAFMFRELLLANSAKGLLVVDRGTLNKSGISTGDLAEMYTEIGGIIDLKLSGGRRLSDVFQQITTTGDGLLEINAVLAEIESKIYKVIGVNEAMLGAVGNEAAAAQVRQRIQEGAGVNGLIFDNFARGLETHVHQKVIPLVVYDLMSKQPKAIRDLSENRERWLELNYDKDFELFVDAIKNGEYQTKLVAKNSDQQMEMTQSAMLMDLALARPDVFSPEAALEFSPLPHRGEFLRRNRELMRRQTRDQQLRSLDLQSIAQIMAEQGIDEDTAEILLKQMRKEAATPNDQSRGANTPTISRLAAESTRQSKIEEQNFSENA